MWSSQVSNESTYTPRNFVFSTCSTFLSSINSSLLNVIFCFLFLNIMKCVMCVFLIFSDSMFLLSHSITLECQIEGPACLFIFNFLLTWPKLIWPYPFIFSGVIWQPVLSFKSDRSTESVNPVNFDYLTCHLWALYHLFYVYIAVIMDKQGKSEGFESCDRPIVRKRPIWVKIGDVLSRVKLKFEGWPWKTIGHLSFAVSSFLQHFIAIGEFKLELLSGNAQFGSNSTIFRAVWPWNLTYDLEKQ